MKGSQESLLLREGKSLVSKVSMCTTFLPRSLCADKPVRIGQIGALVKSSSPPYRHKKESRRDMQTKRERERE